MVDQRQGGNQLPVLREVAFERRRQFLVAAQNRDLQVTVPGGEDLLRIEVELQIGDRIERILDRADGVGVELVQAPEHVESGLLGHAVGIAVDFAPAADSGQTARPNLCSMPSSPWPSSIERLTNSATLFGWDAPRSDKHAASICWVPRMMRSNV